MFMAASSVTRYLRTKGSATRVMVWDVLHVRQMTWPLMCPTCRQPSQHAPLELRGSIKISHLEIRHSQINSQGTVYDCDKSQPRKTSPEGLAMCAPRAAVSLGCMVGVRMDPQLWQASMTA